MVEIGIIKSIFWISIFLMAYTYVLYPIILLLLSVRKESDLAVAQKEVCELKVSLIISAYNEEYYISDKLINTLAIDYPKDKLEVIIASDGSTDKTDEIIAGYADKGIKHIRFEERSGKIGVLNKVIPTASGDIIVLSDANTIYLKSSIKNLINGFNDPNVGCVCGRLILQKKDESSGEELEIVYWNYETILKKLEGKRGALLGANGGIYAFRKELFKPLPANTIVEDFVIPMNILIRGYKVVFEPAAVALENVAKDLANEQIRKVRIGAGVYQAFLMTLPMLNIFRGFPSFAYWSHKVIRWAVPFLMVAILAANAFLLREKFYMFTYLLQGVFAVSVLLGLVLNKKTNRFKIFNLSYYFFSMNICLLLGFIKFITQTQKVTWKKAER